MKLELGRRSERKGVPELESGLGLVLLTDRRSRLLVAKRLGESNVLLLVPGGDDDDDDDGLGKELLQRLA